MGFLGLLGLLGLLVLLGLLGLLGRLPLFRRDGRLITAAFAAALATAVTAYHPKRVWKLQVDTLQVDTLVRDIARNGGGGGVVGIPGGEG